MNKFLKFLCSFPIIFIVLYFIPFLGICLILFRYYVYRLKNRYYFISIYLLVCGLFILVPKVIHSFLKMLDISNIEIPYLNTIINSDIYINLVSYSKLLITVGIIFLVLSVVIKNVFNNVSNKLNSGIRNYMEQDLQKDYEIRKENDLKMQEKREKTRNTHVVNCPYCGSDNMLTEQTGTCKFCRRRIEYKN